MEIKWKLKKFLTVRTVLKSNRKFAEKEVKSLSLSWKKINHSLSWLVNDTSIKSGRDKLVVWPTSPVLVIPCVQASVCHMWVQWLPSHITVLAALLLSTPWF